MYDLSARAQEIRERLLAFMREVVEPGERDYHAHVAVDSQRWSIPPVMEEMKRKARAAGLWNLFLPDSRHGAGLSNLDYARLAEIMGRSLIASEVFNCSAPDTGNMEVLHLYGNEFQKKQWLEPLLAGEIRSGFAMTEPDVASSDATNIRCRILREGDVYRISGRKWWTTGALDPRCRFFIVMGETNPEAKPYARQSMVIVPRDAPGVRMVRPLTVFGYDDAPLGHAELAFEDVRVPLGNLIYGEGKGFEIAQGRLGPGRVHHCMRLIGLAERALEAMVARARSRIVFGQPIARHGMGQEAIALSRVEIEQARLLTLSTAWALDKLGTRGARDRVAMIKIAVPRMACAVIDRAIQVHGGAGLSSDHFLAQAYAGARSLRIADGPDEVHLMTLAKMECERGSH
ncbi:MAG: acyl-CoA dehydrogenase [Xanthomonadales bacterium PRO6]|nr:(R)-benzylsuccinyl-CoA dehydrogenase [Xanthomonadales bacterium]MCE7932444.1 acyl-CoA dehydrogenase [Xanthomonadales bacterium PRO6]